MDQSIEERMNKINASFRESFGSESIGSPVMVSDMWVVETHDDYVIVSSADKYFRVGFSETDGSITFEPREKWIEVVRRTEWDATKAAMINRFADSLVTFGDAVKALGDGKVGGYLVTFSSKDDPDLTGDFFTPNTDFGPAVDSLAWFNHRLPVTDKKSRKSVTVSTPYKNKATLTRDEVGILSEIILDLSDEYERMIYKRAEQKRLRWSSGTAAHLVERKSHGAAQEITRWPLGLDASFTPTAAEPKNLVMPIKSIAVKDFDVDIPSLLDLPEAAQENRDAGQQTTANEQPTTKSGDQAMSEEVLNELKTLITAQGEKLNALETVIKNAPAVKTVGTGVQVITDEADRKFANVAEQCRAIKAAVKSQGRQYDPRLSRLDAIKAIAGANETVSEDGAYLLEPTISPELLKPLHDFGMFSSAARPMPVMSNSNSGWINGVDETDLSAGLVWGGVIAYRVAEGGSISSSKPKFRRINWQLKKYAALVYDTDELLQDAGQFQAVANQACNEAIVFLQNDDIVRGDGAAGCWGILSNGSLVTVTKETGQANDTVIFKNLSKMWQRLLPQSRANATWFINSEVEPELDELSIPAGTAALEPKFITYDQQGAMRIKGRPVVVTPFNSALGDVGDIILADMSAYLMWTKGGIQTAQSIHVEFLTDQNVFRFIARADGQPVLASAITPFKGTNTQSNFVTLGAR